MTGYLYQVKSEECGRLVHSNSKPRFQFLKLERLLFICSFLAALGLHGCLQAFLWLRRAGAAVHCGLQPFHCGRVSCCRAPAPEHTLHSRGSLGSAALRPAWGIFLDRGGSRAPCLGRRLTLDHQGSLRKVILNEHFIAEGHPETSSDPPPHPIQDHSYFIQN